MTIRSTTAVALLALAALSSAGCTSESSAPRTTSASTNRDKAAKYATCMREAGVDGFPDPDASGELTIDEVANQADIDTSSPSFERAVDTCRDLQPSGFTGHTRSPAQQSAAIDFAECVRDHGVPDFPDPGLDDPMIDTRKIPSTARAGGMRSLHAAMDACRDIAGKAGVTK